MKSKTIILSQNENKGRGILTLFQENELLQCRIRLYNIEKLSRYCKIGVYHQSEVYSANLLERNGVYESSFVGDFDIDQDFYTAIIDTSNNNRVILSGGTYAGYFFNDNSVFEKENNCFKTIEKEQPNTNLYTYTEEKATHNFDKIANKNNVECADNCDKCATCKYKEFFYNHTQEDEILRQAQNDKEKAQNDIGFRQTQNDGCHIERNEVQSKYLNQNNNEIEQPKETEKEDKKSVIQAIIPQFKYVFENYEQDDILNALIPNSKFVKINENNEQYSIGAIYENNEMKYICYALMCNYNTPAPTELGEHYQWLPLDKEDPLSEGYYIVFQDASDLKILEL